MEIFIGVDCLYHGRNCNSKVRAAARLAISNIHGVEVKDCAESLLCSFLFL
jgi:hypothetical protein